jgi:hypothetical protein
MPQTREELLAGFSTELQLLLACIGHFQDEDPGAALTPFLDKALDWTYLLALANRHGVMPLLRRCLSACPAAVIPDEVTAQLKSSQFLSAVRATVLGLEQRKVLMLLAEHEIPAMPYKGVFLGEQLYGDASLRPTSDIDLIIHGEDVVRAKEILVDVHGYEPDFDFHSPQQEMLYLNRAHEYELVHPESSCRVELHWDVSGPEQGFCVSWPEVWARAEIVESGGVSLEHPRAEDLLIILAIHGGKHQWDQLRWLGDIAALLQRTPDLDWDAVHERARAWRAERAVQLVLVLVNDLLGVDINAPWLNREAVAALADQVHTLLDAPEIPPLSDWRRLTFRLQLQDRSLDRVQLAQQWVFGLNFQDMATADTSLAGAYVKRPIRLLRKRGVGGVAAIIQRTAQGLWQ